MMRSRIYLYIDEPTPKYIYSLLGVVDTYNGVNQASTLNI